MGQLEDRLIDRNHLPAELLGELDSIQHQEWTLFSVHLAMNEPPRCAAASFDADVDEAWIVNAGYETPRDLIEHFDVIRAGGLPDPVAAGLKGVIKITGDMRILMQQAEIVSIILELYTSRISTEWPKGKPPY